MRCVRQFDILSHERVIFKIIFRLIKGILFKGLTPTVFTRFCFFNKAEHEFVVIWAMCVKTSGMQRRITWVSGKTWRLTPKNSYKFVQNNCNRTEKTRVAPVHQFQR